MKALHSTKKLGFLAFVLSAAAGTTHAQTSGLGPFAVTSPGFFYQIDGFAGQNPTLTLQAGVTYTFNLNTASIHPVVIVTNNTAFPPVNSAFVGASPQNLNTGSITLTIPATNYPSILYYRCNFHGFNGAINIVAPTAPAPPPNQIVSVSVTTNVVLVSTGTNTTWVLTPEFNSNVVNGVWAPVPSFTTSFANGTNITQFDRLEPLCGPNVFLRIRQTAPSGN